MKKILPMMGLMALLFVPMAVAQEWSAEQQEVWKVVQWTWDADDDTDWCEAVCHANVTAWDNNYPAPRNRETIQKWWKRNAEKSKTLEATVTPVSIVVEGNVGVAHYYYSVMSEDMDGKRETEHGRYTDVLVKENDKWVYITWSGGEIDDD
ncbi:MAG: nuclear transport factor 2 family protein [Thermoanaerobaculia bacterium]|nr:nuclear transport factor 2 family protein [Thermoanaerobaculia bacterium]